MTYERVKTVHQNEELSNKKRIDSSMPRAVQRLVYLVAMCTEGRQEIQYDCLILLTNTDLWYQIPKVRE